jgi:hypothetical protein
VKQSKRTPDFLKTYSQEDFTFLHHCSQDVVAHCHEPVHGIENVARIYRDCKQLGLTDKFRPATEIAYDVMNKCSEQPGSSLATMENVRRAINRGRAQCRPKEPGADQPNFPVNESYFRDNFFRGEAFGGDDGDARHLIFATKTQLSHLCKLKYWYVDGTFKLVKLPFRQLFTINGFLTDEKGKRSHCTICHCSRKFIFFYISTR